ncbi:MAG: hypothetical protein HQL06_10145 [Nitrospirae bacterium]|nr:hypothetical protein [Nitrospirota bacterium]MBF0344576.1 hypothetical protein [Nitrospirota bacterium]
MSETITDTVTEAAVTNPDVEHIIEILPALSPERIKEAASFIDYLADRERRHKIFVEETLAAEQEEGYTFDTVEEAMEFIRNWKE